MWATAQCGGGHFARVQHLDVLQRFAPGLRHKEEDEEDTDHQHSREHPKYSVCAKEQLK